MDGNYAKKIIDKIKTEHIQPQSRTLVISKRIVFWSLWIIMMLFGALFFSFIVLNLLDFGPEVFHYVGARRFLNIMLLSAPYLWIALLAIAFAAGYFALKKTKHGYRYSILFVTSMCVLIVSLLGFAFHLWKVNDFFGDRFANGPVPRGAIFPMHERWHRPGDGMLGGEITEISLDNFMLVNFDGELWKVVYSSGTKMRIPKEKLVKGMKVEVFGEKTGGAEFHADMIRPFPKRPGSLMDHSHRKNRRDVPKEEFLPDFPG